jgi:uncharacterized protein (DUF1778 family)
MTDTPSFADEIYEDETEGNHPELQQRVELRVRRDQFEAWKEAARLEGINLSAWLRQQAMRGLKRESAEERVLRRSAHQGECWRAFACAALRNRGEALQNEAEARHVAEEAAAIADYLLVEETRRGFGRR